MKLVVPYYAIGILLTGMVNVMNGAAIYAVTDLGDNYPAALNDKGQVVGGGYDENGTKRAFLYNYGQFTYFGVNGDDASAINNLGQVVGGSLVYSDGQIIRLASLTNGGTSATGINDSGVVVGYARGIGSLNPGSYSYIYTNGVGSIFALGANFAINNRGQIAGEERNPAPLLGGPYEATIRDPNGVTYLGTLGSFGTFSPFSAGRAINEQGDVAGYSTNSIDGDYHAFLYRNGSMVDLGILPGATDTEARGINDLDQVVGYSYIQDGNQIKKEAFLYTNGGIQNLNDLIDPAFGITLDSATDINNNGQIVATGYLTLGEEHGYLLTPLAAPVPEPTTIGSFLVGLIGLSIVLARTAFRSV